MQKALDLFKKFANDKPILWGALGLVMLLRMVVHSALYFTDNLDAEYTLFGVVSSLGIILLTALIPFKNTDEQTEKHNFFQALTQNFILLLILAIAPILTPYSFDSEPSSYVSLLVTEAGSVFALYTTFHVLYFIAESLIRRRHKNTFRDLKYIGLAIAFTLITKIIARIFDLDSDPFVALGTIAASWFVFTTNKKLGWITSLPLAEKKRIKKFSIGMFILSIMVASFASDGESQLGQSLFWFAGIAQTFVTLSAILSAVYVFRIMMYSFKNTSPESIVERRTKEVSSLTHLNKVVSETVNLEQLMNVVTQLAQQISRSGAAWIELNNTDLLKGNMKSDLLKDSLKESVTENVPKVISAQGISPEQALYFHHDENFDKLLKSADEPVLIESLHENPILQRLALFVESHAKSMIVVPLYSGEERIGTLVVVTREEYGFEPDDVKVLKAFSDNISVALENIRLVERSLEKERYERELMLAQKMQRKLLPEKLPVVEGFEISAHSIMAQEVGGDYYDVVKLRDGRACIVIADVSGKGISAAFYMAKLKGVVLGLSRESDSLHELLSKINRALFGSMERQMYITLACVVIEHTPGLLSFARAGHTPMLVRQGGSAAIISPKGLGIGLANSELFDKSLEVQQINLLKGDSCLLFTDGISERANAAGIELGYTGLLDVLRSPAGTKSDKLLEEVSRTADFHAKGLDAHDDMTVLAIVFKGKEEESKLLEENFVHSESDAVVEFSKL